MCKESPQDKADYLIRVLCYKSSAIRICEKMMMDGTNKSKEYYHQVKTILENGKHTN